MASVFYGESLVTSIRKPMAGVNTPDGCPAGA